MNLTLEVYKFLKNNPNPSDEVFHKHFEGLGVNVHDAEACAYKFATKMVEFLSQGRSVTKNFTEKNADPKELTMGIGVELEHTKNKAIAKRIALDHLSEIPTYYSRLKKMEAEAGIKD